MYAVKWGTCDNAKMHTLLIAQVASGNYNAYGSGNLTLVYVWIIFWIFCVKWSGPRKDVIAHSGCAGFERSESSAGVKQVVGWVGGVRQDVFGPSEAAGGHNFLQVGEGATDDLLCCADHPFLTVVEHSANHTVMQYESTHFMVGGHQQLLFCPVLPHDHYEVKSLLGLLLHSCDWSSRKAPLISGHPGTWRISLVPPGLSWYGEEHSLPCFSWSEWPLLSLWCSRSLCWPGTTLREAEPVPYAASSSLNMSPVTVVSSTNLMMLLVGWWGTQLWVYTLYIVLGSTHSPVVTQCLV